MWPKAGREHGGRGFWAGQTGLSAARTVGLLEPWLCLQSLFRLHSPSGYCGILSSSASWPLAIFVESSSRWNLGFVRVSPTDVHVLSYHSDVSVVSENREDNIVEFEMIARDPEWQHIPRGATIDVSNERLIRLIWDGKVVTEIIRESIPNNIAFHVRLPNLQSFPALFGCFRAEPWINVYGITFSFEQTWTTRARRAHPWTCLLICWYIAVCDVACGLLLQQVWYIRALPIYRTTSCPLRLPLKQCWSTGQTCCREWGNVHGLRNHSGI